MTVDQGQLLAAYEVVFHGLTQLGPGDADTTRSLAQDLSANLRAQPRVADLGCGVGASALVLAAALPTARILAVDAHGPFVARLQAAAMAQGVANQIAAEAADMAQPPALDGVRGDFDLLWCESAIYALGRGPAFIAWRPLLRPGGWLVFSDLVWAQPAGQRAPAARAFWEREYPAITDPDAVIAEFKTGGFLPRAPVSAGAAAWSNYYEPLRQRLRVLTGQADHPPTLVQLIAELTEEVAIYDQYADQVAPMFFCGQRGD